MAVIDSQNGWMDASLTKSMHEVKTLVESKWSQQEQN